MMRRIALPLSVSLSLLPALPPVHLPELELLLLVLLLLLVRRREGRRKRGGKSKRTRRRRKQVLGVGEG